MKRMTLSLLVLFFCSSMSATVNVQGGEDRAGTHLRTQETSRPAEQKAEKAAESSTKAGQELAAEMFKRGVPFCIADAIVEPPNKLKFTVRFNPNIPPDKAIKGMLKVKEYPTGSGMFVEVTYARTVVSPTIDPQSVSQEIAGLTTTDGAVLIIQVIGLFNNNEGPGVRGGVNVSNRVKLERVNGKWTTATLNMDSN